MEAMQPRSAKRHLSPTVALSGLTRYWIIAVSATQLDRSQAKTLWSGFQYRKRRENGPLTTSNRCAKMRPTMTANWKTA